MHYLCKKTITSILFTCRVTNNDYNILPSGIRKLNTLFVVDKWSIDKCKLKRFKL